MTQRATTVWSWLIGEPIALPNVATAQTSISLGVLTHLPHCLRKLSLWRLLYCEDLSRNVTTDLGVLSMTSVQKCKYRSVNRARLRRRRRRWR